MSVDKLSSVLGVITFCGYFQLREWCTKPSLLEISAKIEAASETLIFAYAPFMVRVCNYRFFLPRPERFRCFVLAMCACFWTNVLPFSFYADGICFLPC